ncbi:MAG: enolase C-terminal domain-like protein, partial [Candidatus Latescibacterota bacterium]|nr:enolase C-terminal domain-like protein [Candidatus Latescibacterota bacterium]
MKIDRIEVCRIHVPMKSDTTSSGSFSGDTMASFTSGLDKHILKVYTDDGLVGLGETWKGTPDLAVCRAAEVLLGVDPTRLSLLRLDLPHDPEVINPRDRGDVESVPVRSIVQNPSTHAFEIAVADILGQAYGVPVCQLLGGAVRDKVLVHYWSGRRTPEDLAAVSRQAQERGFTGIKIKCALDDPHLERAQAVYDACGPEFRLTMDPNMRFGTVEYTLRIARELAGLPIEVFEDPIPKDKLDDYVRIRQEMDIPLALHLEHPEDVLAAIAAGAADMFNLRGTMSGFVKTGYMAEVAGMQVWRGSGLDLGILDASYTHACAVVKV